MQLDHIRVTRNPIRPNGVNDKVLPGSSKGLKTVDTFRPEACSSGTNLSMPTGPAVISKYTVLWKLLRMYIFARKNGN